MTDRIDFSDADAQYRSPPSFKEWAVLYVNTARLQQYLDPLQTLGDVSGDLLKSSLKVVTRAAAIDTGALEKLYEVDTGFTLTVAAEVASWQAVLEAKGAETRALIESQLEAYEYVLDFVTGQQPLAETWIRQLHSVICAGQKTYRVITPTGEQDQALPKGVYKSQPNHVLERKGTLHPYAPVHSTPAEMAAFVGELQSEAFLHAHPILQASYAHYAFVVIHPFADGNGRVARALASVPTYRAYRVPVLILSETRSEYLKSLKAADLGQHQIFVDFMLERALDALQLAYESFRTASLPEAEDSVQALKGLFVTKGGLTHKEIEDGARQLLDALYEELVSQSTRFATPDRLVVGADRYMHSYNIGNSAYRGGVEANIPGVRLITSTPHPVPSQNVAEVQAEVPKNPDSADVLLLRLLSDGSVFTVRVNEVVPDISVSVRMRLSIFAERLIRDTLAGLLEGARHTAVQLGYGA